MLAIFAKAKYFFAMTKSSDVLARHGVTAKAALSLGMNYQTVWCHLKGTRNVSPQNALEYEALFGIPRWELRPDLWPAPEQEAAAQ